MNYMGFLWVMVGSHENSFRLQVSDLLQMRGAPEPHEKLKMQGDPENSEGHFLSRKWGTCCCCCCCCCCSTSFDGWSVSAVIYLISVWHYCWQQKPVKDWQLMPLITTMTIHFTQGSSSLSWHAMVQEMNVEIDGGFPAVDIPTETPWPKSFGWNNLSNPQHTSTSGRCKYGYRFERRQESYTNGIPVCLRTLAILHCTLHRPAHWNSWMM